MRGWWSRTRSECAFFLLLLLLLLWVGLGCWNGRRYGDVEMGWSVIGIDANVWIVYRKMIHRDKSEWTMGWEEVYVEGGKVVNAQQHG